MSHRTVDQQDWSLLDAMLLIVTVLGAWPAVGLLANMLRGRSLGFDGYAAVAPPAVQDPSLSTGVTGVYTGEATFTVAGPSPVQWLCALIVPLLTFAVVATAVLMVRRLVRNARGGRPFHPSSLRAVRVLGMVLFCYGLFRPLIQLSMLAVLTTEMRGGDFHVVVRVAAGSGWPVAIGLIVGVVGESIFGRGRALAEDTEGLV